MNAPGPPVRIGVLGAANVTSEVLLRPARIVDGIEVAAIAARDPHRAHAYAAKHGIPRVHRSYEELLADPELDGVYVPLPAALHAEWTIAAIETGKHVLCEKPFTSNTEAAVRVAQHAAGAGLAVMEAYHSHYHPLRRRLHAILDSGELGEVLSASATFCGAIPPGRDIRWNAALGGGALLDIGYYPLRLLRELFGEVVPLSATARTRGEIDARIDARLRHAGGMTSNLRASMWDRTLFAMRLDVKGTAATMRVGTPYHPQMGGRIHITRNGHRRNGHRSERPDRRSSYAYQLDAFRDVVTGRKLVETGPAEAIPHQAAVDAIYRAAGMRPRASG